MTTRTNWEKHDSKTKLKRFFIILISVIVAIASYRALDITYIYAATAPREIADMLNRMAPPDTQYAPEVVQPLIETVHISILGTILALFMALPVGYLGAENTTPNDLAYAIGKLIISATRSVNVIIWALIFVVMFGPGVLAGVCAIAVRSIGFLAKLTAESIEEIDSSPLEAISATGAGKMSWLIYAVIPQIKADVIGITVYRWDTNVRNATVIGFVGAGGIGIELMRTINFYRWSAVATILIGILIIVLISEGISAYARKKVRTGLE